MTSLTNVLFFVNNVFIYLCSVFLLFHNSFNVKFLKTNFLRITLMFFRSFLLNSKIFFSQKILYLNFRFFCSEEFCEDGFAITTACQNLVEDGCALLITDYPGKPCQTICQTKPPDLVEDGCALLITDYPGKLSNHLPNQTS